MSGDVTRPRNSGRVSVAKRAALGLTAVVALLLALGVRCDRPAAEVEARWATAPSQFVAVDGLRVHLRDRAPRAEAPALVLVHGSNSSLFTWEGWAEQLKDSYRVIALDLPGHGLTGPDPRQRYSPSDMAQVVDRVVHALGVERFAIAGSSMGGSVAWHYALAHPEKVAALILVDAAGYPREEPRPLPLRIFSSPLLGRLARWISPRFVVARSVRTTYGDPTRVTEERIDAYDDFLLREGNREATRVRLQLPEDGMSARLPELKVPTLILWGGKDTWISPRYGERFHSDIAGSRLVVFDSLGHIPMEEDPAATAAAVRAFLAEVGR
jgi:pimeloyl-ACP methyl ester carboxylesterase